MDDDDNRWTVTVVDARSASTVSRVKERVHQLREAAHDHLPRHGAPLTLAGGGLAVLQEEVPGADLATVCAARGAWTPAEVVTVLVPLAGALAALHARGLAHGDVSAANVVLRPDGRAVLVDLICGDDPAECGTPGVAAPERVTGARAPGDVHALARLGLRLLGADRSRDREPPSDTVAMLTGRAELVGCLEAASAATPEHRPDADHFASSLYAACRPAPVDIPDAAVLARAALRRLAESPAADRTTWVRPRPRRERGRHRRSRGRGAVLLAAMTVVLVIAAVLATTVVTGRGHQRGRQDGVGPQEAAVRLTVARTDALSSGDMWALRDVTVIGSRAAAADAVLAWAIRARAASGDGMGESAQAGDLARRPTVEILGVERLPPMADASRRVVTGCGTCARVLITARFEPARDEEATAPPRTERAVVLVLRRTAVGWRVLDVEAAPDGS